MMKKAVGESETIKLLLNECEKVGYKNVVVNMTHKIVPQSVTFSFGGDGNVFAHPPRDIDGWPAIWRITEKLGIGMGCGNLHQHQIRGISERGAWRYNKNKWERVA